jgi:hypothetical protein
MVEISLSGSGEGSGGQSWCPGLLDHSLDTEIPISSVER